MKAIRRFTVRPVLPEPLRPLADLAHNLRWSWHEPTRALFATVDSDHDDPVRALGALDAGRLADLAADQDFLTRLRAAADDLDHYLTAPRWYQRQAEAAAGTAGAPPASIAYFSPEFGVAAALPQYSGGLGILAGDHLKAASDLGVPLIGVGLLYRNGYFRQSLSRDGWQQEHYPVLDPGELPVTLLRETDGTPARVTLALPGGRSLHAHIRIVPVGRVPLLMLDSDVEENAPGEREVTDRLYGGGSEHRLLQEMLLGIGGVRAVRTYCRLTGTPAPEVFHTNEGHAGFLGLERIRELGGAGSGTTGVGTTGLGAAGPVPGDSGTAGSGGTAGPALDFDSALEAVRAGTVFTTHTPVPAGIDRFDRALVARHLGDDGALAGVDTARVLALGDETPLGGDPDVFNMAAMGLRLAQRANGVSTLHGAVSRAMFAGLWPGFDPDELPLTSVTNGVHAPTWTAPDLDRLGPDATDRELWELRRRLRERLVTDVRRRVRASWRQRGAEAAELGWTDAVLDPDVLTIGFARRVPSYKRLTLMLRDKDRLRDLLLHPERPVQLVVAGKAHPADDGGKRLVQELVRFADDPRVRHRIVFLPDYGIDMARGLYPGCDVWLNNPLRPLEACGTSGMKAALNGCLNLSVLDGWWDEWYEPDFGWAIPTADGAADDEDHRDDLEAAALYDLVEHRVAPRFYERDADGVPTGWTAMVRRTLTDLGPKVHADRMVQEYVERLYVPAATAHRALGPDAARELAAWKARVRGAWAGVSVDHVEVDGVGGAGGVGGADAGAAGVNGVGVNGVAGDAELGATPGVRVRVDLGGLTPEDVEVQAVTGRVDADDRILDPRVSILKPAGGGPDLDGRMPYEGALSLDRTGAFGCAVRVLPAHALLAGVAEMGLVAVPGGVRGAALGFAGGVG
ncbi:alpha-glucan family phosphorylase [Streptomyces sp. NPDC046203]|uniref:alpha-glucan family phosphorylase n=1 Tax=Streptomyces sp. NPDC046203 TaxID=3154602 RepID=UPI0033D44F43